MADFDRRGFWAAMLAHSDGGARVREEPAIPGNADASWTPALSKPAVYSDSRHCGCRCVGEQRGIGTLYVFRAPLKPDVQNYI